MSKTTPPKTEQPTNEFVPDVPAQIEEKEQAPQEPIEEAKPKEVASVIEEQLPAVVEETESEEVLFLRNILAIQHNGGWGHHLDDVINERIKSLTA